MKGNHSLTNEELTEYSEIHLLYEINMLFWTTSLLLYLAAIPDKGEIAGVINNALLNSFSVHARNLIDFLYSSGYPTDVILGDYISDSELTEKLPPITELLANAKSKTDKQVSHITLERITYEKRGKEWRFVAIHSDIMNALYATRDLFLNEKTSPKFREAISKRPVAAPKIDIKQTYESGQAIGIIMRVYLKDGENGRKPEISPVSHTD